ncbi:hypothetical protein AJ79_07826 [Helicocarpus griseus UAMH5409]|uniref:Kinase n=1 Tax=Helicocarpus griseus UAMH5409 TaxID=1447875 RepID=A0A2B7WZD7_9EURO|nr:hypothetical protein AJ79_07826 [Helicocarpus griseus UAMH5409]
MSSTPAPESRKAPKLDEGSFVAFGHATAGHDGVLCDPSGSLIAKPCTAQEIEFYESGPQHPGFWQFMPRFIGTLSNDTPQDALEIPTTGNGTSVAAVDPCTSSGTDTPLAPELSKQTEVVTVPVASTPQEQKEWVPSGGQKINTNVSVVLENVTAGFKRPSVLDVKLGARLWADDALPAKRDRLDQVSRETTSSSLGFRIAGMKVWVGDDAEKEEKVVGSTQTKSGDTVKSKEIVVETVDGYRRYDKWYGRSFNADNIKEGFETFLAGAKAGKIDRSKMIAKRLADKLREIQLALEAEESRMYSASVLIVYEADPEAFEEALVKEANAVQEDNKSEESGSEFDGELPPGSSLEVVDIKLDGESIAQDGLKIDIDPSTVANLGDLDVDLDDIDEDEVPHKVHDIRLIDFAHARWTPGEGPDENALQGIRSLVRIMDELAKA